MFNEHVSFLAQLILSHFETVLLLLFPPITLNIVMLSLFQEIFCQWTGFPIFFCIISNIVANNKTMSLLHSSQLNLQKQKKAVYHQLFLRELYTVYLSNKYQTGYFPIIWVLNKSLRQGDIIVLHRKFQIHVVLDLQPFI